MKLSILLITISLCMLGMFNNSDAFEAGNLKADFIPYIKGGSIGWDELEGIGGHKFMIAGGLNTVLTSNSHGACLTLEYWTLGEGLDDDKGVIPDKGYNISGEVNYKFQFQKEVSIYPYTSVGFERWQRDARDNNWTSLRFFDWTLGIGTEYKAGYLKVGVMLPFSVNADRGSDPEAKPGFSADLGMNINNLVMGLFYKHLGFEDPDSKMVASGLLLGYRFK